MPEPAWSIAALKPHVSAKGAAPWPEVVRTFQSDLAASDPFRRICLERLYFQYADAKTGEPRKLMLQGKAVGLAKPKETIDPTIVEKKLGVSANGCSPT